jgi:peroxiredoxin
MIYILASTYGGACATCVSKLTPNYLETHLQLVAKMMSRVNIITFNYYSVKFIYPLDT